MDNLLWIMLVINTLSEILYWCFCYLLYSPSQVWTYIGRQEYSNHIVLESDITYTHMINMLTAHVYMYVHEYNVDVFHVAVINLVVAYQRTLNSNKPIKGLKFWCMCIISCSDCIYTYVISMVLFVAHNQQISCLQLITSSNSWVWEVQHANKDESGIYTVLYWSHELTDGHNKCTSL